MDLLSLKARSTVTTRGWSAPRVSVDWQPADLDTGEPEYLLRVGAGENHTAFAVYQEESFFEVAYNLSQAAPHYFQLAPLPCESFAQLPEPRCHPGDHLVVSWKISEGSGLVGETQLIDAGRYCFQWVQKQVGGADCDNCGCDDGHETYKQVRFNRTFQLLPNARLGYADVQLGIKRIETLLVFVDRWTEQYARQLHIPTLTGELVKARAVCWHSADHVPVGCKLALAPGVGDDLSADVCEIKVGDRSRRDECGFHQPSNAGVFAR